MRVFHARNSISLPSEIVRESRNEKLRSDTHSLVDGWGPSAASSCLRLLVSAGTLLCPAPSLLPGYFPHLSCWSPHASALALKAVQCSPCLVIFFFLLVAEKGKVVHHANTSHGWTSILIQTHFGTGHCPVLAEHLLLGTDFMWAAGDMGQRGQSPRMGPKDLTG